MTHYTPAVAARKANHPEVAVKARGSVCTGCWLRESKLCSTVRSAALPPHHPTRLRRIGRDQPVSPLSAATSPPAILRSGYLRLETMTADGRRNILGLAVPGDLISNWQGKQRRFALETASDVELCVLDRALVKGLVERDPDFRLQLLRETEIQHARQLHLIWQRGALTSRERAIAFLLLALETMPTRPIGDNAVLVRIEISRRDWADLANTTVETISRTLSFCARGGLIECVGPQQIIVRDLQALTNLAGHETGCAPGFISSRFPRRSVRPAEMPRLEPEPRRA